MVTVGDVLAANRYEPLGVFMICKLPLTVVRFPPALLLAVELLIRRFPKLIPETDGNAPVPCHSYMLLVPKLFVAPGTTAVAAE